MIQYLGGLAILSYGCMKSIELIQQWLMFKPIKLDTNYNLPVDKLLIELKEKLNKKITLKSFFLKTNDKQYINCLFLHNPYKKGTIIFAHGNSGNITHRLNMLELLGSMGSVIMFDYRGYGKSTGTPSVEGLTEDIKTVWNFLTKNRKIKPYRITLYGTSIGCGPVTELSKELLDKDIKPYSIILQSGFSSIRKMGENIIPSYLINTLIPDVFNNKNNLLNFKINIPILISHSTYDEVIPYSHATDLLTCKTKNSLINFYRLEGFHSQPKYDEPYIKTFKQYIFE